MTDEQSDFLHAVHDITGILADLSEKNVQAVVNLIVAMYALGFVEDDRTAAKTFLQTTFADAVARAFDTAEAVHRHALMIESERATKQ